MISNILNVTYVLDASILDDWEQWFESYFESLLMHEQVVHVRYFDLKGKKEPNQESRCIHLEFATSADVHKFYSTSYLEMGNQLSQKFGEKCLYFGSLLELISEKSSN